MRIRERAGTEMSTNKSKNRVCLR